jgi:hypothetical protein
MAAYFRSTNTIKKRILIGRTRMKSTTPLHEKSASKLIDERIGELGDWRGKTLAKLRRLVKDADSEMVEEVKWRKPSNPNGIPVWYHKGGVCTGEIYKDHAKFTFFQGASLEDPSHLFNRPGTVRQAIDIHEADSINEASFKRLIQDAVALNLARAPNLKRGRSDPSSALKKS